MGHFARDLSAQEIKQGYALLNLMEHLDREMDMLNKQRIRVGPSTKEGQRLTQIKQSHLRKLQTCISELNSSGFNDWLLKQQPA